MTTIKDIAKLAGVSQGTVSNVLSKKDNVSSDKIKKVLDAAKQLDYVPNYNAKSLRKGYTKQLHLILPNIQSKTYNDIYQSFKNRAIQNGLKVNLMISDDNVDLETDFINALQSELESNMKIAVVTSLPFGSRYRDFNPSVLDNVLFLVKDYIDSIHHISYHFQEAGSLLAKAILKDKHRNIGLLSSSVKSSSEEQFKEGVLNTLNSEPLSLNAITVDPMLQYQSIVESIREKNYDAFILSDFEFAQTLHSILYNFMPNSNIPIYLVSPLFIMQEPHFVKYELNYRNLAHIAADCMISDTLACGTLILNAEGFRDWNPVQLTYKAASRPLKILTVNNPSARILETLAGQFNKLTGISIELDIRSYDEVYEILSNTQRLKSYDIIRNDINWMSWFGSSIYTPFDLENSTVETIQPKIIQGLLEEHLIIDKKLYALPFSPSTQVMFYRKDLFERIDIKRHFKELHGKDLEPPKDFDEYNLVARFFTREYNPESPTQYGATLTLGNTGVAGSEFLSRYYAQTNNLFEDDGSVDFMNVHVQKTLEQIRELKQYSDPNYDKWWTDTAHTFASGNVAMAIMYSNYSSDLLSINSKVLNKIGSAPVPGNNPLIGGGAIGVCKYSTQQSDAFKFLLWLSSETISSSATLLGNLPSHMATYSYYEILDLYPWFTITRNGIKISNCLRVPHNSETKFNEKEMLQIIGSATIETFKESSIEIEGIQRKIQAEYEQVKDKIHAAK